MHLGSLVAAVGSYLDARANGGRWLVRMEDLDAARVVPGSADRILSTLERFGLTWDGDVLWQSRHRERYLAAARELCERGLAYPCSCSRRELPTGSAGYSGKCRSSRVHAGPTALRFRVDDRQSVAFDDGAQGDCRFDLAKAGDFVIVRKDGTPAYQLAVVLDDALQQVTNVVRGSDLLDSTAWQIALQQALGLPPVCYLHLPVVMQTKRGKLAKSRRSLGVDANSGRNELFLALELLGQRPDAKLVAESPAVLLEWAVAHWNPGSLHAVRQVAAPAEAFREI